jgi:hypothetical protein
MLQQFHDIHGRKVAAQLNAIFQSSYPTRIGMGPHAKKRAAQQMFKELAIRQGYSEEVVRDFLQTVS